MDSLEEATKQVNREYGASGHSAVWCTLCHAAYQDKLICIGIDKTEAIQSMHTPSLFLLFKTRLILPCLDENMVQIQVVQQWQQGVPEGGGFTAGDSEVGPPTAVSTSGVEGLLLCMNS